MPNVELVVRGLYAWTPFLAAGFVWNIVISLAAMTVGTSCGYLLARLRLSQHASIAKTGSLTSALTRSVPTFVFQFYLVFMLPETFVLPGTSAPLPFPAWLKAALALSLAVAGFVSDNLLRTLSASPEARRRNLLLFVSSWGNYFVIIVMASSTASVIGVSELVSRCNTVINATGRTDIMLWVYLYAMTWFFFFCYSTKLLIRTFSNHLDQ